MIQPGSGNTCLPRETAPPPPLCLGLKDIILRLAYASLCHSNRAELDMMQPLGPMFCRTSLPQADISGTGLMPEAETSVL